MFLRSLINHIVYAQDGTVDNKDTKVLHKIVILVLIKLLFLDSVKKA
jgi:hypothetical protein